MGDKQSKATVTSNSTPVKGRNDQRKKRNGADLSLSLKKERGVKLRERGTADDGKDDGSFFEYSAPLLFVSVKNTQQIVFDLSV